MRTERITVLVVTGGRGFDDRACVFSALDRLDSLRGPIEVVAHGDADPPKGKVTNADRLSGAWGRARCKIVYRHPAVWKPDPAAPGTVRLTRTGKPYDPKAGHIRNGSMLRERQPQAVLEFPGGAGTLNCITQAKRMGIEVINALELLRTTEATDGPTAPNTAE